MVRATRTRFGAVMVLGLLLSVLGGGSAASAASRATNDARVRPNICASVSPAQCGELDTTTELTSSVNFSRYGQDVTFTATVSVQLPPPRPAVPVAPTGTVDFQDGGTTLCAAVSLDGNGEATCTKHTLVVGTHTIGAFYHPNPNEFLYNESSDTLDQIVKQAGTRTIMGSSSPISRHGHAVIFSAFVFTPPPGGGIPTGKFQFGIDGVKFGAPVTIQADGRAFLPPIANLAVGQHRIGGTYLGDSNHRSNKPVRLFQLVVK
jgi:hypothetical protein